MRSRMLSAVLLAGLAVTSLVAGQTAAVNTPQIEQLSREVRAVAALTNGEYIAARTQLEAKAEKDLAAFQELGKTSPDWQVRLLSGIVIERVQEKQEITRFLDWKPQYPHDDSMSYRYHRLSIVGKALAERGSKVPMLLVEKLWKDNEVKKWTIDYDAKAYVARALGLLKVQAARQPLEEIMLGPDRELSRFDRQEAAQALGELGDPKSVPALVRQLERDPEGRDLIPAGDALAKCADADSLSFLEQELAATNKRFVREELAAVIAKIKSARGQQEGGKVRHSQAA
jgi:hypothetical protein